EEKDKPIIKLFVTLIKSDLFKQITQRFDFWSKTLNLTCYILRLGFKPHHVFRKQLITIQELQLTSNFLIKVIQKIHFANDYDSLTRAPNVPSKSILLQYTPFIDTFGVIRSKTRLELSETLPYDTKFPIILPNKVYSVEKLILHLHIVHFHANLNYMLALLREKYVLIKGRRELTRILHKCLRPKCVKPVPLEQIMSPFPTSRIDFPICFQHISVDLYGPLFVKSFADGEEVISKVWGAIFTCLVSRAIHLKVMNDMGTEEFLNCFHLMASRKGCPSTVYSDRGKYFLSADKELKLLYRSINWTTVQNQTKNREVQWIFNPPLSPFKTGSVERLVGSVKKCLKVVIGTPKLTSRQLGIIMSECEGIINNRPLTTVSSESLVPVTAA
ncbi:MAG: hypothetical protein Q8O46_02785, partial [bacterium]|nr:hypothetical protein [bacterium]